MMQFNRAAVSKHSSVRSKALSIIVKVQPTSAGISRTLWHSLHVLQPSTSSRITPSSRLETAVVGPKSIYSHLPTRRREPTGVYRYSSAHLQSPIESYRAIIIVTKRGRPSPDLDEPDRPI